MLCCAVLCREVEGPPPDDYPESDEDAVQQQHHLREHKSSTSSFPDSTFSSSGTHDPLGDLTWPLETSKTVSRGASSQLLAIGQGVGSSAAAAAAAAASAAGAGITSLLANRGKSTERQRPATSVSLGCCLCALTTAASRHLVLCAPCCYVVDVGEHSPLSVESDCVTAASPSAASRVRLRKMGQRCCTWTTTGATHAASAARRSSRTIVHSRHAVILRQQYQQQHWGQLAAARASRQL